MYECMYVCMYVFMYVCVKADDLAEYREVFCVCVGGWVGGWVWLEGAGRRGVVVLASNSSQ
jgi:hypothetical protein